MNLSRTTLLKLIEACNFTTNDEIRRFALEFNFMDELSGESISKKETSCYEFLIDDENKNLQGPNGSPIQFEILEYAFKKHIALQNFKCNKSFFEAYPEFITHLKKDGYEITEDGVIRSVLPSILPIAQQEDTLKELLVKHDFTIALNHYEQAIEAHARGKWASANGQLRTFIEDLFNQVHDRFYPEDKHKSSHEKKIALTRHGFFLSHYNEFHNDGKGFVEGFWQRLHPEGSHPGLSDEFDSTFRLHLVILVAYHFMTRFDKG